jgi:hypothetical protein
MLGRRLPAYVELVDSSEVIWPDVIRVAAHGLETGQNSVLQASVIVMAGDLLFESLHSGSGAQAAARFAARVSAVVGSITRSTLVILLAGKPLFSACSRISFSLGAW